MKNLRDFNYQKTARLDTEMWRAYYRHNFLKLFRLFYQLMRSQFQFGRLAAIRATYYGVVAASVYRITFGHEANSFVEKKLARFYKLVSDHATEKFDHHRAATIELEWWNIHRYPTKYSKTLSESLAEGMATIYNGKPSDFKKYADYRTKAMDLRDSKKSQADWKAIDESLQESWKALYEAAQRN